MDEIFIDFLEGLKTLRRAVGVPRSVKTVSKLTVSEENVKRSEGEVVKSSEMHEETRPPEMTARRENIKRRRWFI